MEENDCPSEPFLVHPVVSGDPLERPKKRIVAEFYVSDGGNEPVRDELRKLSADDRKAVAVDIRKVEYGWPIGMPTCQSLGSGIWEIRTDFPDRIFRVLFCAQDGRMILLHAFIKKTQKTPPAELKVAIDRKKNMEARLRTIAKQKGK